MPYESIVMADIDGAGLVAEGLLTTWTQTLKIFDFDPSADPDSIDPSDTKDFLREVLLQLQGGEFPKIGDAHASYPEATCLRISINPLDQTSTTHVAVRLNWAEPGPFCSITTDTSLGREGRNYDVDGVLTEVRYDSAALYSGTPSTIPDIPFIATIQTPVNTRSLRVTQFENIENEEAVPNVLAESEIVFFNKDAIWGFDPGELLYIGRRAVNAEGTRLYRTEYFFLIRETRRGGWAHSFAVFQRQDGLVPRDVQPYIAVNGVIQGVQVSDGTIIFPGNATYAQNHPLPKTVQGGDHNGSSAFRMIESESFGDFFGPTAPGGGIKPPFNPKKKN